MSCHGLANDVTDSPPAMWARKRWEASGKVDQA